MFKYTLVLALLLNGFWSKSALADDYKYFSCQLDGIAYGNTASLFALLVDKHLDYSNNYSKDELTEEQVNKIVSESEYLIERMNTIIKTTNYGTESCLPSKFYVSLLKAKFVANQINQTYKMQGRYTENNTGAL